MFMLASAGRLAWHLLGAGVLGPRIACQNPVFDAGVVPEGTVLIHEFLLRNTGTAPVEILGIRKGCRCATVGKVVERIDSGEECTIVVKVYSAGKVGPFRTTVLLQTNDRWQPNLLLSIAATISSSETLPSEG